MIHHISMHKYIILGDDIYTLDTIAERALAVEHMRDAGVKAAPVYRGGPAQAEMPIGRAFCACSTFDCAVCS